MNKENSKVWYMVFNPYPDGKKPTVRHETLRSATIEAERVCLLTGKKIHVLKIVGTMHPPKMPAATWSERE